MLASDSPLPPVDMSPSLPLLQQSSSVPPNYTNNEQIEIAPLEDEKVAQVAAETHLLNVNYTEDPTPKLQISKRKSNARYEYIEYLRVVGSFGVVVLHMADFFSHQGYSIKVLPSTPSSTSVIWQDVFEDVIRYLHQWIMPFFFFLAGFSIHFSLKARKFSTFQIFKERLLKILLPALVTHLVVVFPACYFLYYRSSDGMINPFRYLLLFFTNILYFRTGHVWFLYCLLLCTVAMFPIMMWLQFAFGITKPTTDCDASRRHVDDKKTDSVCQKICESSLDEDAEEIFAYEMTSPASLKQKLHKLYRRTKHLYFSKLNKHLMWIVLPLLQFAIFLVTVIIGWKFVGFAVGFCIIVMGLPTILIVAGMLSIMSPAARRSACLLTIVMIMVLQLTALMYWDIDAETYRNDPTPWYTNCVMCFWQFAFVILGYLYAMQLSLKTMSSDALEDPVVPDHPKSIKYSIIGIFLIPYLPVIFSGKPLNASLDTYITPLGMFQSYGDVVSKLKYHVGTVIWIYLFLLYSKTFCNFSPAAVEKHPSTNFAQKVYLKLYAWFKETTMLLYLLHWLPLWFVGAAAKYIMATADSIPLMFVITFLAEFSISFLLVLIVQKTPVVNFLFGYKARPAKPSNPAATSK